MARTNESGGVSLSLEDVLRFGLSGTVVLLTVIALTTNWITTRGLSDVAMLGDSAPLIIALGGALSFLLGAIVYSLHRAIIHPIVERVILRIIEGPDDRIFGMGKVWKWNPFTPTDFEVALVRDRWHRNATQEHIKRYFHRWGSQTHFLHTIPQAYWLGSTVGCLLARAFLPVDWLYLWASVALFLVACIDDYRLTVIELSRIRFDRKSSTVSPAVGHCGS